MKILGYDEVNSQQVLELNIKGFGWFLSPVQMELILRVDNRVPDYIALYAVEDDVVQSQVGVVTLDTQTAEGMEEAKSKGLFKSVCAEMVKDAAEILEEMGI